MRIGAASPKILSFAVLALSSALLASSSAQAQTWTSLNHQPSVALSLCLLLTDGTVMCQSGSDWYKLTPDLTGSYVNGTWSQIASLPAGYAPNAYASAVLADGRVVITGGEYDGSGNFVLSNQGAVYDPKVNTWTPLAPPPGWSYIGDAPACVLANGQFLIGSKLDQRIAILDPATLTWTQPTPMGKADPLNAEEGWALLPDGSVFTLDVKNAPNSERYLPSTSTWVNAGTPPINLASGPDEGPITVAPGVTYTPPGEVGPGMLRPDGTLFQEGGNGHTAIFTPPPANSTAPGTWVRGPDFPNGLVVDDGPAAALPNGHVLAAVSPPDSDKGVAFFEFDGVNLNPVPANQNAAADASNYTSLLLLPTGQVLLVDSSNLVQIYTSTGTYNSAWAPTVSSVPSVVSNGFTYHIAGTQFNGLSQGSAFGDENENATNYPLVRIANNASGHVFYARTHGHSSMGVATGSMPVSTNFDVPANTELGASQLVVVANGIPSAPISVTVTSSTVPPVTLTCPANVAEVGLAYNSALMAAGGQPPYVFSIPTGSLPTGLMLTQASGAITGMPGTPGVFSFTAQVADSSGQPAGTTTANCSITAGAPPSASFQGQDTNTQGSWVGTYGHDGYFIANDATSSPSYAGLTIHAASTWTWAGSTTDPRALLASPSTSNRIASTYYSSGTFTIDLNLSDAQMHQVAFYLLDFDSTGRAETISILDANTNNVLSTRTFSGFHSGVYAIWNLAGHVLIQVANNGGLNAVMSGIFFGAAATSPPPSASAVFVPPPDAATQGNWVGKYGAGSFMIANDPVNPAGFPTTTFTGASTWTWAASTTAVRAPLMSPTSTDRIASTYYSNTSFTIDLNPGDTQQHQLALYLLDFDDNRAETISILDATTHAALDTESAANFQNGVYLVWNIQGHVLIQVTCTGGLNAVVSGLFYATPASGGQPPPTVSITAPTANQTVSGNFTVAANASSSGETIASVQLLLDGNPLGAPLTSGSGGTYSYPWATTTVSDGPHSLAAIATDNLSQKTTSTAVSFSVKNNSSSANSATFTGSDTTTEGNWKGKYGALGEIIADDSNHPPSDSSVTFTGASPFTWAITQDPRALLMASSTVNRTASTFYNAPGFNIDVHFTDSSTHQVALYLLDWDNSGRAETIAILDPDNNNAVLDTRPASSFRNGQYLVWNVQGHVIVQVTATAGPNAVVSGIFFQ